jgi:ABC-type branched-subunit amino acid transport system ATPase component
MNVALRNRPDLMLTDITVRFGGLTAVDGVSLHAKAGEVTGLIGPNGAGKTTMFNATTGVVPVSAGSVQLGDRRLDHKGTAARARAGLGRTFQRMELFDSMSVADNVAMGPEMRLAGHHSWLHLVSSRRSASEIRRRSQDAIGRCGIESLANRLAGELSTGQRRLVELARAVASRFDFLLLDEPSSGLDGGETEHFIGLLRGIVEDDGIGLLVVEHDMTLVRSLCRFIYVLDFGRLICEGPADQVLASEVVKAAYLGDEAATPARGEAAIA